jgi:hypothetical protein
MRSAIVVAACGTLLAGCVGGEPRLGEGSSKFSAGQGQDGTYITEFERTSLPGTVPPEGLKRPNMDRLSVAAPGKTRMIWGGASGMLCQFPGNEIKVSESRISFKYRNIVIPLQLTPDPLKESSYLIGVVADSRGSTDITSGRERYMKIWGRVEDDHINLFTEEYTLPYGQNTKFCVIAYSFDKQPKSPLGQASPIETK